MKKISRRQFMQATAMTAISSTLASTAVSASALTANASISSVVIEGFDWGPAVTAAIIELPQAVRPGSVRAADFTAEENKESFDWATFSPAHVLATSARTVEDAYTCRKDGAMTALASRYIRLEFSCPVKTGSPFCYDFFTSKNTWCTPYELKVQLNTGAALTTVWGKSIDELNVDPVVDFADAQIKQLDAFDLDGKYTGANGQVLSYAFYAPASLGLKKLPLVIWLHGMGEGGSDPSIALLGNKVTALAGDAFQDAMGGAAYVLVPQTSTFWLEWDPSDPSSWGANPGVPSVYTETLMELIENFVAQHPAIDTDRIYIGGCSNGGYMTVNMALRYPDYFAAAYTICEAYMDSGISDAEINSIKNVPLWFVYAQNDTTVDPTIYEKPTIERLKAIGANVKTSIFADVHDTSGKYTGTDGAPYQYTGHWSWLYFFNNDCVDDATGENMWDWLAMQHK